MRFLKFLIEKYKIFRIKQFTETKELKEIYDYVKKRRKKGSEI